eukprot:6643443-Alexandrium_andersonii.AAC.1
MSAPPELRLSESQDCQRVRPSNEQVWRQLTETRSQAMPPKQYYASRLYPEGVTLHISCRTGCVQGGGVNVRTLGGQLRGPAGESLFCPNVKV